MCLKTKILKNANQAGQQNLSHIVPAIQQIRDLVNVLFKTESPKKYRSEPSDVTYMSKSILQASLPQPLPCRSPRPRNLLSGSN